MSTIYVAPYKSPYIRLPVANAPIYNVSSSSSSQAQAQASLHPGSSTNSCSTASSPITVVATAYLPSTITQISSPPRTDLESLSSSSRTSVSAVPPFNSRLNINANNSTQNISQNAARKQYQSPYGRIAPATVQNASQPAAKQYSSSWKQVVDHMVSASPPKGSQTGLPNGYGTISNPQPKQDETRQHIPSKTNTSKVKGHAAPSASKNCDPQKPPTSSISQNTNMNSSKIPSLPHNNSRDNSVTAVLASNAEYATHYQAPRPSISYPAFTSAYEELETDLSAGPYFFKKTNQAEPHPFNMGPIHSHPFSRSFQYPKLKADPTLPAPLTEFHYFSKLPVETRTKIWAMSCPQGHQGRVIEVRQKIIDANERDYTKAGQFYTSTPYPALLHLCQESRQVALKNWQEMEITSVNNNSLALEYLKHQVPEDLDSTFELQVPARISFRTRINWNIDILYLNPEHMSTDGFKFYCADGRFYPETPVIRFIEAMAENPDTRNKLRYVAFYKDILRDNNTRHTKLGISPVAFQAISAYLLQMSSLSRIGVILDEQCCIDHPEYHDEPDQAIIGTVCETVQATDTIVENGGHLITKMAYILRNVARTTTGFAQNQAARLPQFLSMKINRQKYVSY